MQMRYGSCVRVDSLVIADSERNLMGKQEPWVQEYVDRTGRIRWQPRYGDEMLLTDLFTFWANHAKWQNARPALYRSQKKAQRKADKRAAVKDRRFRELI